MMAEQVRVIITTVMSGRGRRERSRCQNDCHCRVWVEWIATATVSVRDGRARGTAASAREEDSRCCQGEGGVDRQGCCLRMGGWWQQ